MRLARLFQQLRDTLRSKELVGVDKAGNKYFRWYEHAGGQRKERREVRAAASNYTYEPQSITGEWRMWLHKTRLDPPTEQELAASAAKAAALRKRVELIEEREKMRRFQRQSMGEAATAASAGVEAFLQDMGKQGFAADKQEPPQSGKPSSS